MPSRVFDQLDAVAGIFLVDSFAYTRANNGNAPAVDVPLSSSLIETGIGSFTLNLNLNSANNPDISSSEVGGDPAFGGDITLRQEWTVNYNNFPSIPDNARIKKLVFRRPRSVNYNYLAQLNGVPDGTLQFWFYSEALLTSIYFTQFYVNATLPSKNFIESYTGVDADEVLFDYTSGPTFITKADLINNWSDFNNNIYGVSHFATSNADGINATQASLIGSLTFGLGWTVTVTYDEVYQFSVSQDPSVPIDVGSTVTLKSPETVIAPLETVDFNLVTDIDILVPDPLNPGTFFTVPVITFTPITAHLLTFIMPDWAPNSPAVVHVQLTSTQFGGTVEKQLYTILFVSASGIYQLVPGKTSDTLYIEAEPGETIDVKIPDPYGKTGFFAK